MANNMKASKESIQMINLKCPNCDQILNVEDDMDTFYCKYCGGKILISDEVRLNAKVRMKEIEHKTTLAKLRMEKDKQETKMMWMLILIIYPLLIIAGVLIAIFH